jgi:O-antigen/teichoic acid export membrane protein
MRFKDILWGDKTLRQTIFKNTFWLFAGQIISRGLRFFLVVYAARILGANVFGSFYFAISFTALTFLFSDVGINTLIIREFAKNQIDRTKLISTSFYLKAALILLSSVATVAFGIFNKDPLAVSILWFMIGLYALEGFRDFLTSIARGAEKMELEGYIVAAESVITTIVGITFLYFKGTIVFFALAYLLGALFSLAIASFLLGSYLKGALKSFDIDLAKDIFIMAWPFVFAAIVIFSLTQVDAVMLGWLKDSISVGEYSAGARIVQVLLGVIGLIAVVIYPVLSRIIAHKDQVAVVVKKAISLTMFIMIPICIGGFVLSKRIILALFGAQFLQGAGPFSIMLFTLCVYSITTVLDYLLLAFNLQKKDMEYTSIAAGLNVVLNFIFIIRWGIIGAAVSTAISQSLNLFLTARLANKNLTRAYFPFKQTASYVFAAAIMLVPIFVFWSTSIWFLIPIAALIYLMVLLFVRAPVITDTLELLRS